MKFLKALIVLALAAAVFGTAGFFAWKIFVQPDQAERAEAKAIAEAPPATPPPDYSLPAFERALALKTSGELLPARDALIDFIAQYPQSTKLAEARAAVGEINTHYVFTGNPGPDKLEYSVVSGDSLLKIAGKTQSSAELILRSNNLASIDLSIGQTLLIPQLETALVVDRAARTLTVLNKGQFFKEYPLLGIELPSAARGKEAVETKVTEKVAFKGADRVPFGSRDYVGSDRWIMLGIPSAIIRGFAPPEDGSAPAAMPPGIVVSQEDIEEIFPLVTRGTGVTIQ